MKKRSPYLLSPIIIILVVVISLASGCATAIDPGPNRDTTSLPGYPMDNVSSNGNIDVFRFVDTVYGTICYVSSNRAFSINDLSSSIDCMLLP